MRKLYKDKDTIDRCGLIRGVDEGSSLAVLEKIEPEVFHKIAIAFLALAEAGNESIDSKEELYTAIAHEANRAQKTHSLKPVDENLRVYTYADIARFEALNSFCAAKALQETCDLTQPPDSFFILLREWGQRATKKSWHFSEHVIERELSKSNEDQSQKRLLRALLKLVQTCKNLPAPDISGSSG
jgi:hypothetical protein